MEITVESNRHAQAAEFVQSITSLAMEVGSKNNGDPQSVFANFSEKFIEVVGGFRAQTPTGDICLPGMVYESRASELVRAGAVLINFEDVSDAQSRRWVVITPEITDTIPQGSRQTYHRFTVRPLIEGEKLTGPIILQEAEAPVQFLITNQE